MPITIFCLVPFFNFGRMLIVIIIEAILLYVTLKPTWKLTLVTVIAMNAVSLVVGLMITLVIDPNLFRVFASKFTAVSLEERASNILAFYMILERMKPLLAIMCLIGALIFNVVITYFVLMMSLRTVSKNRLWRTSCVINIGSYAFLFMTVPGMSRGLF